MDLSKKIIGCVGKCSSGLTLQELDQLTDDIQKTLNHCKSRRIFREFLDQGNRTDDLACLDFYEKICEWMDNEESYLRSTTEPTLVQLTASVDEALEVAADLNGIPEIDNILLKKYDDCLMNPSRDSMIEVLRETKHQLIIHLENGYREFRTSLFKPCPKNK